MTVVTYGEQEGALVVVGLDTIGTVGLGHCCNLGRRLWILCGDGEMRMDEETEEKGHGNRDAVERKREKSD